MEADGQASQLSEEMKMDQHLARLEQDARQSRLVMEADGQASTKTRERTEGAATAAQAMRALLHAGLNPAQPTRPVSA